MCAPIYTSKGFLYQYRPFFPTVNAISQPSRKNWIIDERVYNYSLAIKIKMYRESNLCLQWMGWIYPVMYRANGRGQRSTKSEARKNETINELTNTINDL